MSAIEWCDVTWNPVVGCSRVSDGCDNCYAIGVAARNLCDQHRGLTKIRPKDARRPGADWTGEVRTVPSRLADPFGWRKPRRVFVNSMSDLFHEHVPPSFRAAVFAVMAACPQHTFIVVTKRPDHRLMPWRSVADVDDASEDFMPLYRDASGFPGGCWWDVQWPLANVHMMVSAEDQYTWTDRVPRLLEMAASVRGVSAEPLLGPVRYPDGANGLEHLDWLVIGGESGRGSRICNADWIRSLKTRAEDCGVSVFVKQLGSKSINAGPQQGKGNDMASWPEDLRVRDFPQGAPA